MVYNKYRNVQNHSMGAKESIFFVFNLIQLG
jgi:hypothetical protein